MIISEHELDNIKLSNNYSQKQNYIHAALLLFDGSVSQLKPSPRTVCLGLIPKIIEE